jgi:hypothetical protein
MVEQSPTLTTRASQKDKAVELPTIALHLNTPITTLGLRKCRSTLSFFGIVN